ANRRLPMPAGPPKRKAWGCRSRVVSDCQTGRCHGQIAAGSATDALQHFFDDRLHFPVHLLPLAAGIDYPVARRISRRALKIGIADLLEERPVLLFEAVQLASRPGAGDAHVYRNVEQQHQVRTKLTLHPRLERSNTSGVDATATALIGVGRISEAITDHDAALGQRRPD